MQLKAATFSDLFKAAFIVGAAFDGVLVLLGLIMAILNPAIFHAGAPGGQQVPASSPMQAVGILMLMALTLIVANLVVSAGGAAALVLGRRLLPSKRNDVQA